MTWYQLVRWYWTGPDDDASAESEVILTSQDAGEIRAWLEGQGEQARSMCEVVTSELDPRDLVAWAHFDGDPELDRFSAADWLDRQRR